MTDASPNMSDGFHIVVVGAHLSGLILNGDLVSRGARLVGPARTSNAYRLYALPKKTPSDVRKPALKRVAGDDKEEGAHIDVEVWSLPAAHVANFLATIAHPLGIGSIELDDGSWRHGFICEPVGLQGDGVQDITAFGGWRAFLGSLAPKKVRRVLVANRGEIAVRIIRTLHAMGREAVAIYAAADAGAPHVRAADGTLPLGTGSVAETYLNGSKILELATKSSAAGRVDAVIPGYGFLAENADFAAAVEAAGLVWIGPTPDQMRRLGLKHTASALAVAAALPIVPGINNKSKELHKNVDEALATGVEIGYPVMLKSTAGGGGIGLRRCDDADALEAAFDAVQRLSTANFGNENDDDNDNGLFLERFVERARHIEVQIVGDGTGRVWVVAGERDCSLQRRHQKVVEESPAPNLPGSIRQRMQEAALDLAASVQYRSVATVEFLYDPEAGGGDGAFYFLEVNTRLQVEHGITEAVTGLDLVEVMVRVADGRILDVHFPPPSETVRIDTWVAKGTEITSLYDPLLAKIIVSGKDRATSVQQLIAALQQTRVVGLETNLDYLLAVVSSPMFVKGEYTTNTLEDKMAFLFKPETPVVEVVEAGPSTTIQDYPGRTGLWHTGIPPSGPMDSYSFRLANRSVGNKPNAPALEATLQGPVLRFHTQGTAAVTGATVNVLLDGEHVPMNAPFAVKAGQVLRIGTVAASTGGYRTYLAVRGGLDVPLVLGSRSTFAVGQLGGHNGRALQDYDLLRIGGFHDAAATPVASAPATPIPMPMPTGSGSPPVSSVWHLAVVPGPHGAPDFFTHGGFDALFSEEWMVHYNSNRLGVRLTGPRPQWAAKRKEGGDGGLHPSNINDAPYSVGSISFTGDEAIVLTCDGPSLGGFVVFGVVATADQWKLGQARPGDRLRLHAVSAEQALAALERLERTVDNLTPLEEGGEWKEWKEILPLPSTAIVGSIRFQERVTTARQAGDCGLLLEFGDEDAFDVEQSIAIFEWIAHYRKTAIPGVVEMTPGVRTLHVHYERGLRPETVVLALKTAAQTISSCSRPRLIPSRRLRFPIAFDDTACREAVARYADTIRGDAPWIPDNVEFLRDINGLKDRENVENCLLDAEYLVLGLGDVFLGSPCSVALDPRHRLAGTKYNPSRSHTPRSAVGLGGQYLCIYGGATPGGYQLVGRTAPVWDEMKIEYRLSGEVGDGGEEAEAKTTDGELSRQQPWLLRLFDRISFYRVDEAELDLHMVKIIQDAENDTLLDVDTYKVWLASNRTDVDKVVAERRTALLRYPRLDELLSPAPQDDPDEKHKAPDPGCMANFVDDHSHRTVQAGMPGRCFRCVVQAGDRIEEGDTLLWMESNKMELQVRSPAKGTVVAVHVAEGDLVAPTDVLAAMKLDSP